MSNPPPRTKPKLLVILGAGSSVELGMPSVDGLAKSMKGWAKRSDDAPVPDYFDLVWKNREQAAGRKKKPEWAEPIKPNYERCLGDLHALMNGTLPSLGAVTHSDDLIEAVGLCSGAAQSSKDLFVSIQMLLDRLLSDLALEFRARCADFARDCRAERKEKFSRYCALFSALRERFDLGVYNLNHDTVALTALGNIFTGFARPTGCFVAAEVQSRREWDFLYHLHGSVHFNLGNPNDTLSRQSDTPEMWWVEQRDCVPPQHYKDSMIPAPCADNRWLVPCTLVAGGWKLDQIQAEPFQTFYSTLPRHAHEADAVLIAGYGFGDEHVNSVLANMLKAREGRRPPVMVLDFRTMEARPLEGERRKGLEFVEPEDSLQSGVRNSLNTWNREFRRAKRLDQPLVEAERGDPVRSEEYAVCFEDAYPVAVWFGGFLAAAERTDEIANWLLRHVPAR